MNRRLGVGVVGVVAAVACAACTRASSIVRSPPPPTPPPPPSSPPQQPPPKPSLVGAIDGIATAHDVPIALVFDRGPAITTALHAGRFAVADLPPGEWDVIIAGDGFARIAVPGVTITADHTTDVGTLHAHRGHRIAGTVLGIDGNPASGATVRLVQDAFHRDTSRLVALARGNQTAITNSHGVFTFDGLGRFVSLDAGTTKLVATLDDALSPTIAIAADRDEPNLSLALVPIAALDGRITGGDERGSMVTIVGPTTTSAVVDEANAFHASPLATGTYTVGLFHHPLQRDVPAQRIFVGPGATPIALAVPADATHAALDAGRACTTITLRIDLSALAVTAPCTGTVATFTRMLPGRYRACVDRERDDACPEVTIAPRLLVQWIRI